jgi:hypothetical protein
MGRKPHRTIIEVKEHSCSRPLQLKRRNHNVLVVLNKEAQVDAKHLDFKLSLKLPDKVDCKTYTVSSLIDQRLLHSIPTQSTLSLTVSVFSACGKINVGTLFAYLTRNSPSPSGQADFASNPTLQFNPVTIKSRSHKEVQWLVLG